ncbi:hypothetical protein PS880_06208 [Pseudomonas fluorescens]|uniref:Uncharacterized protein n=1 Tax=Pseudomonas fluorescens TaxID=294 RepID=A0A5E7QFU2_PSEFL|nr:hypothetical protein PS880_06208 [Pseudomonas fluorescens]
MDFERLRGVDQTVVLVAQQAVDVQHKVATAGEGAAAVIEASHCGVETGGRSDQAF